MSWQTVKIDDITEVVTKGTTPTTYGMPFTDEGVNFVKAEALNGDSALDHDGFTFVSEETHEKLARSILKKDDVLVTIAGANVGRCGFVQEQHLPANTNQAVGIIRVDQSKAEPRFVYYYFKHPSMRAKCLNIGGQAAQPNVNLGNLKSFDVSLPDRPKQKRIASILSAYDDLIENNRRRIALLEEAARLLYREWFVRFRFPGHEHVKIVDGVPEGWKQSTIGEHCPLIYGKALKAETRIQGDIDVYGSSGIVGAHNKRLVAGPAIVVGRKGNVGSIFWARRDFWPIDTVYYVAPENSDFFTYYALQHVKFISTDVAVPGLNRDFAHSRKLLLPTDALLEGFHAQVEPAQAQIGLLQRQMVELTKARDLLLPRLMDGRLEV